MSGEGGEGSKGRDYSRMEESVSVTLRGYTLMCFVKQESRSGESGDVHYTRTTASIRRHASQKNEKQDPKSRRQMKLFNVGVNFACSFVCARAY